MIEVRWKTGARVKVDAKKAHAVIEKARAKGGGEVHLSDVVELSRPKNSALHSYFEWNDKRAGELYRLEQARYLVRSLEYVPQGTTKAAARVYESSVRYEETDTAEKEERRVFRTTEDILADPSARAQLLGSALRDALAFRRRYAALSELASVIRAVDEFVEAAEV